MCNTACKRLPEPGCEIRPASGLEEAVEVWWPLMQKLGWNRSPLDLMTYSSITNSRGLLLAVPNSVGVPKGHVMATINDNLTAWVTVLALESEFQGLGYGRALLSAAMEEIEDYRPACVHVGLDSVAEQKKTYEKRGFVESSSGAIQCISRELLAFDPFSTPAVVCDHYRIINIKEISCALLMQSDLHYTGFERAGLWTQAFLNRADVFGFALTKKEQILGYNDIAAWAIMRRCSSGFRLGPVYADNRASAKAIIVATMEAATPEMIQRIPIDGDLEGHKTAVPSIVAEAWDGNLSAMSVFEELGWKPTGVTYHRMWLRDRPTKAQSMGGLAHTGMFAVFDAAVG